MTSVDDSSIAESKAHRAWERGDLKVALRIYHTLAQDSNLVACCNLGYFYDCAVGIKRNRNKALFWYRRAYRSGSGAAAANIATIYRDEGRVQLEVAWYKRAVALGDGESAVEVAKHYLSGVGVRRHRGHAIAYLNRAVATPLQYLTPGARSEARRLLRKLQQAGRDAARNARVSNRASRSNTGGRSIIA